MTSPVNQGNPQTPKDSSRMKTIASWSGRIFRNGTSKVTENAKVVGKSTMEKLNSGKKVVNNIAQTGPKMARTLKFGIYGMTGIVGCFAIGYLLNSINGLYKTVSERNSKNHS